MKDRTAPLERWLRSQVGRPWAKVWSEVCAVNDGRSLRANHLKDHVKQYVAESVVMIDGRPHHAASRWRFGPSTDVLAAVHAVFVHPVTGLLCLTPRRKKTAPPPLTDEERMKPLGIHRINGIWFHLWIEDVTKSGWARPGTDKGWAMLEVFERSGRWAVERKRQLSRRELDKHGIRNQSGATE